MIRFVVRHIFPVSFMKEPYVVGDLTGDLTIGEPLQLQKADGSLHFGWLKDIDIHFDRGIDNEASLVFGGELVSELAPGDVLLPADRIDDEADDVPKGGGPIMRTHFPEDPRS